LNYLLNNVLIFIQNQALVQTAKDSEIFNPYQYVRK
jgi:hypothetical protein